MMEVEEYLRAHEAESMPMWLKEFDPEFPHVNARDFFQSRVVYYPGCGTDGHAVRVFGGSHAAHCFVYADYMISEEQILFNLRPQEKAHPFMGYTVLSLLRPSKRDLIEPATQLTAEAELFITNGMVPKAVGWQQQDHCLLVILERTSEYSDDHGPKRLAIMFLGADGHVTYDALFCQYKQTPPFGMLLADHGFGGNYSRFGTGYMYRYAKRADSYPTYILVTLDDTNVWPSYEQVPDLQASIGGMHRNQRLLFKYDIFRSRSIRYRPHYPIDIDHT